MPEPRVAFVTGASRGIGQAAAIALAGSGYDVVVTGRTVHEGDGVDDSDGAGRAIPGSLETTAKAIEGEGRRALPVVMDLHDRSTLGAAVQRALDGWGRIDVLVNNAIDTGPGDMSRFEDTPVEQLECKLAANIVSQIVLIKSVTRTRPGVRAAWARRTRCRRARSIALRGSSPSSSATAGFAASTSTPGS